MRIDYAKLGQASAGDTEVKLMMKHGPEWIRIIDPVGSRGLTGYFMFLSPKGALVVYIGQLYKKKKCCLADLTVGRMK